MVTPPAHERTIAESHHGRAWAILVLLAIVAVIHTPALFCPFIIDDYVYLAGAKDLDWRGLADIFTSPTMDQSASGVWWVPGGTLPFYRPVGQISFALDYAVWALQPFGYHLTNLALHLLCTWLTWRLARRLFDVPGAALAVAMVFGLHPLHSEAVTWVSGRFDLLVCVCVLAAVLSYLNWRDGRSPAGLWALSALVWFVVGLGCKETALVLPALVVGVEVFNTAGHLLRRRRLVIAGVTFGLISMLYVAGRFALFGGLTGRLPPPYGLDTSSLWTSVQGIAWNLSLYVLDLVLGIQVEPFFLAQFWRDHVLWMALALAVSLCIMVVVAGLAWRSTAFRAGVAWTALFSAPAMLALPGERNVYLANVGAAMMIVAAFQAWHQRRSYPDGTAPPGAPGRWPRRVARAVVGTWLVLCIVEQSLMWCVAATSERVFRDLQALLPDPPRDARIYVVQQCPLNSVGFAQAIRLRYSREDLSGLALSLSPTLRASSTDTVCATAADSIQIVRRDGVFLDSFIERFHLFSEPVSSLPESALRCGLALLDPPSSYEQLTTVTLRLPHALDDPRTQIFRWDNSRIRGRLDLFRTASLSELRPCELQWPDERPPARAAGVDGP